MDPIDLLKRSGLTGLTPAEEAALLRELSAAYHSDEAAATSRDIQRIAEKVRLRMSEAAAENGSVDPTSPAGL